MGRWVGGWLVGGSVGKWSVDGWSVGRWSVDLIKPTIFTIFLLQNFSDDLYFFD